MECVSERKVEKAQKTATISQSREREKERHRKSSKKERTVTHCEPVLSESDKPPRERECYLVTSKKVRERVREICVLVRDEQSKQAGCFNPTF